jgi:hypothetical protein
MVKLQTTDKPICAFRRGTICERGDNECPYKIKNLPGKCERREERQVKQFHGKRFIFAS